MGRPRKHINPQGTFGLLTIVKEVERGKKYCRKLLCKCACGSMKIIDLNNLLSGRTHSCGCLKRKWDKDNLYKHGSSTTRLYNIWKGIKSRCFYTKNISYKNYGARGITVCNEWLDFECFKKWAHKNGYKSNLTIERIDNDQGYTPKNCKWITIQKQAHNRRSTKLNIKKVRILRFLASAGFTNSELSKIYNIPRDQIYNIVSMRCWKECSDK